jgi:hypothetical protein
MMKKMAPTRVCGQDMDKPKAVVDHNPGMGGVDHNDAYSTSYRSIREILSLSCYYQKHFCHLIDIYCLNSYLLKKKRLHFQDRISSETYRKCNFKVTPDRTQTIR